MPTYGRNFSTRISPYPQQRHGRYVLDASGGTVPIGAPVVVADGATPDAGLTDALPASLATGAQAPKRGFSGIAIYERIDLAGYDVDYTTFSDLDTIPDNELFQVVMGPNVKVVFANTTDRTYLNTRAYAGRIMVAGMGATPSLGVGDYLTPGTGNDTAGYWTSTATASEAWFVVTKVDAARQEIEAEMAF
jgi:hypothetical protein